MPGEKSRSLVPKIKSYFADETTLLQEAKDTGADTQSLELAMNSLRVFLEAHQSPVPWDNFTSWTDIEPMSGPITINNIPVTLTDISLLLQEHPIEYQLESIQTAQETVRTASATGGRNYENLVNQPPADDVLAASAAVVRIDPLYPVTGPTDTRIDVDACEVTFLGRPNESYPAKSGGITGLSPSTTYVVYRDRQTNDWVAATTAQVPSYDSDPVRYVKVGAQSTQVSGGGSWPSLPSPPTPPSGGYPFSELEIF
jgi:hypothetical protein